MPPTQVHGSAKNRPSDARSTRSAWTRWAATGFAALIVVAAGSLLGTRAGQAADPPRPNFVVFLVDDQRWDLGWAMPRMEQHLAAPGITFENAFVTTPFCCPFRASFLAGGLYPRHTGILEGVGPNGGARHFADADTLATALQRAGYRTAMIGKYVNGYHELGTHVPNGWSLFVGDAEGDTAVVGATTPDRPGEGLLVDGLPQWVLRTRMHADIAAQFLQGQSEAPFFLYLAFTAPHFPATPFPEDQHLFSDFVYRERGYGEDLSDKPPGVRALATPHSDLVGSVEEEDEFHRNQLRSLQEIDRQVERIVSMLEDLGVAERTVFVYTSDNGFMWGEHGLWTKSKPYEESIRVPLVIRMPGAAPGTRSQLVASTLDVPATILDLAGVEHYTDGESLVPLLEDPSAPGRDQVFISQPGGGWLGMRDARWKYIERRNGVVELYDLQADPFELENRGNDASLASVRSRLATAAAPLAPLVTRTSHNLPAQLTVGVPMQFTQVPWGGTPPYSWHVAEGDLPKGVTLDRATGNIAGIPVRAGSYESLLEVRDASERPVIGGPQRWRSPWTTEIVFPGEDHDGIPAAQDLCPESYDPAQADADGDGRGDACDDPCDDGIDDDADGFADFGEDLGCEDPADPSERTPLYACDDGIDNDGDGRRDGEDAGCLHPVSSSEAPACDDGVDNDGDGLVDREDPVCTSAWANSEQVICGLGAEIAPLLLLVAALGRRARRRPSGRCGLAVLVAIGIAPGFPPASAEPLFEDASAAAGLHESGQSWGAAWGDFDGDAFPDLHLTQHGAGPRLHRNQGDGTFVELAAAVGVTPSGDAHGAAWADFDGDGDEDLVQIVGASGGGAVMPHRLFVNEGGSFRDAAAELGVDQPLARGRAPLWWDWNRDGRLDLLVLNAKREDGQAPTTLFVQGPAGFSPLHTIASYTVFAQLADLTGGASPELLLRGGVTYGVFSTASLPFTPIGASLGLPDATFVRDAAIADFDGDLLSDVFLVRAAAPVAGWAVTETGALRVSVPAPAGEIGIEFASDGAIDVALSSFGSAIFVGAEGFFPGGRRFRLDPADPRHQGIAPHLPGTSGVWAGFEPDRGLWSFRAAGARFDVIVEPTAPVAEVAPAGWSPVSAAADDLLYVHGPDGRFEEVGEQAGVRGPTDCWSATAGDFDADMDVDLFLVCTDAATNAPDRLYLNDGAGRFSLVPDAGGAAGTALGRGESVAAADYDRDGFLDLVVTNGEGPSPLNDGPVQLFRNRGNANHWIAVDVQGGGGGASAIGARVFVTAGGVTQLREQNGGMHARSQDHARLHFGLGPHAVADLVAIEWPDGARRTLQNVRADRTVVVPELPSCGGAALAFPALIALRGRRLARPE